MVSANRKREGAVSANCRRGGKGNCNNRNERRVRPGCSDQQKDERALVYLLFASGPMGARTSIVVMLHLIRNCVQICECCLP